MSEGTAMTQACQFPLNVFQFFGFRKRSIRLRHTDVWDYLGLKTASKAIKGEDGMV